MYIYIYFFWPCFDNLCHAAKMIERLVAFAHSHRESLSLMPILDRLPCPERLTAWDGRSKAEVSHQQDRDATVEQTDKHFNCSVSRPKTQGNIILRHKSTSVARFPFQPIAVAKAFVLLIPWKSCYQSFLAGTSPAFLLPLIVEREFK